MVIYEVNLDVDAAIAVEHRAWLHRHIAEMLALPGFIAADLFDIVDPPPAPGRIAVCVHYQLENDDALQAYIRDHAQHMRADGLTRFGDRFRATRRVLIPAER